MQLLRTGGVVAAALAVVAWPASFVAAADRHVGMGNVTFEPQTITVAPGDRVVWTNTSTRAHTVTADDGRFNTPVPPGGTFAFTFTEPGTVPYHCEFHAGAGMTGTVNVQGQAATTTTAAPQATTTTARPATTTTSTARATTTVPSTTSTTVADTTTSSSTSSSTTSTTELAAAPDDDDEDGDGGVPVALLLLALLAVLGAGGYGLWRLWPRPAGPLGPPGPPGPPASP